jgi:hypothetical protein
MNVSTQYLGIDKGENASSRNIANFSPSHKEEEKEEETIKAASRSFDHMKRMLTELENAYPAHRDGKTSDVQVTYLLNKLQETVKCIQKETFDDSMNCAACSLAVGKALTQAIQNHKECLQTAKNVFNLSDQQMRELNPNISLEALVNVENTVNPQFRQAAKYLLKELPDASLPGASAICFLNGLLNYVMKLHRSKSSPQKFQGMACTLAGVLMVIYMARQTVAQVEGFINSDAVSHLSVATVSPRVLRIFDNKLNDIERRIQEFLPTLENYAAQYAEEQQQMSQRRGTSNGKSPVHGGVSDDEEEENGGHGVTHTRILRSGRMYKAGRENESTSEEEDSEEEDSDSDYDPNEEKRIVARQDEDGGHFWTSEEKESNSDDGGGNGPNQQQVIVDLPDDNGGNFGTSEEEASSDSGSSSGSEDDNNDNDNGNDRDGAEVVHDQRNPCSLACWRNCCTRCDGGICYGCNWGCVRTCCRNTGEVAGKMIQCDSGGRNCVLSALNQVWRFVTGSYPGYDTQQLNEKRIAGKPSNRAFLLDYAADENGANQFKPNVGVDFRPLVSLLYKKEENTAKNYNLIMMIVVALAHLPYVREDLRDESYAWLPNYPAKGYDPSYATYLAFRDFVNAVDKAMPSSNETETVTYPVHGKDNTATNSVSKVNGLPINRNGSQTRDPRVVRQFRNVMDSVYNKLLESMSNNNPQSAVPGLIRDLDDYEKMSMTAYSWGKSYNQFGPTLNERPLNDGAASPFQFAYFQDVGQSPKSAQLQERYTFAHSRYILGLEECIVPEFEPEDLRQMYDEQEERMINVVELNGGKMRYGALNRYFIGNDRYLWSLPTTFFVSGNLLQRNKDGITFDTMCPSVLVFPSLPRDGRAAAVPISKYIAYVYRLVVVIEKNSKKINEDIATYQMRRPRILVRQINDQPHKWFDVGSKRPHSEDVDITERPMQPFGLMYQYHSSYVLLPKIMRLEETSEHRPRHSSPRHPIRGRNTEERAEMNQQPKQTELLPLERAREYFHRSQMRQRRQ